MRDLAMQILKKRQPEDWVWLALLIITGLSLLFSESFWNVLPF
jgi:hypothetical protein